MIELTVGRIRRPRGLGPILHVAAVALALAATAPASWADDDEDEIPFAVANVFFELNHTDGDLGIHALIDGEAWEKLEMEGPDGHELLDVRVRGRLERQGLTEIFFESAEPPFDELAPEQFFRRFPEGEYEVEAKTLEGDEMESTAEVTHVLPAPPENVRVSGQAAAEDCDAEPLPVVSGPVVISWAPVTRSHPEIGRTSAAIAIVGYQVVVEREQPSKLVMSVDLPPSVTALEIPSGFVALGDAFKFEILVREASGNQTAIESCFEVE
jgi:hypothetical protein